MLLCQAFPSNLAFPEEKREDQKQTDKAEYREKVKVLNMISLENTTSYYGFCNV
jgi:hypothetical protein